MDRIMGIQGSSMPAFKPDPTEMLMQHKLSKNQAAGKSPRRLSRPPNSPGSNLSTHVIRRTNKSNPRRPHPTNHSTQMICCQRYGATTAHSQMPGRATPIGGHSQLSGTRGTQNLGGFNVNGFTVYIQYVLRIWRVWKQI